MFQNTCTVTMDDLKIEKYSIHYPENVFDF
jgi:hypothetical protein